MNSLGKSIESSCNYGPELPELSERTLREKVKSGKEEIEEIFETIDFENIRVKQQEIRKRIQLRGDFSQRDPDAIVPFFLKFLEESDRQNFKIDFPAGFGADMKFRSLKLMQLSFVLSLSGIIPRSSKILKGSSDQQLSRVRAQFFDCWHIALASSCHVFLTFDKGAFKLAKAVFAYSGTPTKAILMGIERQEQT